MHFPSTLSAFLVASRLAHAYIPSDVPSDYTYSALQHTDKTASSSYGEELEALADLPSFEEIANDEDLEIDTSPPPEGVIDEDLVPLDELLSGGGDGGNRFGDDDNNDEDQLDEIPEDELVFDDGDEDDGELPIVDEPVEEEEDDDEPVLEDDDEELEVDNGDNNGDDDTPVLLPTESLPAEITAPASGSSSTSDLPLIIETSSSSFSKSTNWTGGWNTTTFATHTTSAPAGFVTEDVLLNVTRTVIGGGAGGVPTGNPPAGNGEEDGVGGGDDDSAAVAINVRGMVLAGVAVVVGGLMVL